MRLSKRLAIGVLAAMTALSMSACKPSEQPPASSSTGNQPSTSTPSASSGSNSNSSSAASSGSSSSASSSASNVPSTSDSESQDADLLVETRTEKFFSGKNIINSARWTYTAHEKRWIDGKLIEGTRIAASDGWRTYTAFKDYEGVSDEEDINDPNWDVEYRIYPDGTIEENNMTSDSTPGILTYDYCYHNENVASQLKLLRKICKIGTYTIDGTEYYSETYGGHAQNGNLYIDIFCFDKSDTEGKYLRYRICQTKNSKGDKVYSNCIIKVTGISNTFDENLLRIPEGYKLYRYDPDTGKLVLVTESTPKDNYPN